MCSTGGISLRRDTRTPYLRQCTSADSGLGLMDKIAIQAISRQNACIIGSGGNMSSVNIDLGASGEDLGYICFPRATITRMGIRSMPNGRSI